jgi:hypothetical protein
MARQKAGGGIVMSDYTSQMIDNRVEEVGAMLAHQSPNESQFKDLVRIFIQRLSESAKI